MAVGEVIGTVGGKLGGGVASGLAITAKLIPYVVVGGLLGWLLFLVYERMFIYTIELHLKEVVGKGKRLVKDIARVKTLKNGARMWALKKLRIEKLPAPNSCWIHGKGGKVVVEGWLLNDQQIIWSQDNFDPQKLDEKIAAALVKEKALLVKQQNKQPVSVEDQLTSDELALLNFNAKYQPTTTDDRLALSHSMEDADFGKKDLGKLLEKYIPIGLLILILALVLFGSGYYAKGLGEANKVVLDSVAPIAKSIEITTDNLVQLKQDVQVLRSDLSFLKAQSEAGNASRGK